MTAQTLKTKPLSPVIVVFKALPDRKFMAVRNYYFSCSGGVFETDNFCIDSSREEEPCEGNTNYIWRELPPKESK